MSRLEIEVVLCSKSRVKRDAADIAFARLDGFKADVIERDGDSGVPNQPYDHLVTLSGAIRRAHGLRQEWPDRYILAVENGIAPLGQGYVDLAYVVVLTPDGRIVIRHSESVPVPPELVERSRASGWNVTAGKLEAARTPGCDHADPHVVWSGGKTDRRTLLASAILDAMKAATHNPQPRSLKMPVPKSYRLQIADVVRQLPVFEVAPGVSIAIMNLLGDAELTEAAGKALAALVPSETEVLVMPDGKAIALLHVIQRETGLPAVVARKRRVSYMREPVLEVSAVSITTQAEHKFFLGADDVAKLKGKDALIIDDVISTGGTLKALDALLDKAGALVVGVMAVGTEGDARPDVIALHHFPVFTG